uniref:Uncharacterized protein n=1 Tax=Leersia perrieri TaxID=77586 RepID=A0A0D9V335_9ORYZ
MKVLRLLAARRFRRPRRAVSTITATAPATPCGGGYGYGEDEGPFFELDLSSFCSASATVSSAESSGSESEDYSSCAGEHDDFVISLQRSRSASPSSYERVFYSVRGGGWAATPAQLKFCAFEPSDAASVRRGKLRTLSFGSAKAALYGGRASFSRSSSSARIFATFGYGYGSPDQDDQEMASRRTPSRDVIRRYISKISRQLRRVAPSATATADLRLRKSRSASAAQMAAARSPPRRDDSLIELQDGIASAIAHCKESLHRASVSECDSPLLRSRSDPRS